MRHPHGQDPRGTFGDLNDPARPSGSEGDGPLDEDVLSGFERGDRLFLVVPIRCTQDDGIQLIEADELVGVHDQGDAEAAGERLSLVRIRVGHRHELDVLALGEDRHVHDLADRTGSDHADPNRRRIFARAHRPSPGALGPVMICHPTCTLK